MGASPHGGVVRGVKHGGAGDRGGPLAGDEEDGDGAGMGEGGEEGLDLEGDGEGDDAGAGGVSVMG